MILLPLRVLPRLVALLLGVLLVMAPAPSGVRSAHAEDGEEAAEEETEEAEVEIRILDDDEADELADRLARLDRRGEPHEVLEALEGMAGASHEELHKPLVKLAAHESTEVALAAAQRLLEQRPEDERDAGKLASRIWKRAFGDRENDRRWVVKARLVRAVARLEGEPLSDRDFRDVEKIWRGVHGAPDRRHAPALVDLARYVEESGDKRLSRMLAEAIDEPGPTSVNAPSNPPASYWEERWYLWNESRAAITRALKTLTGQSFKSTEEAKAWFEENEREFGFSW